MDVRIDLLYHTISGLFAYQQKLATFLFLAAKKIISKAWKKPKVTFQEVKDCMIFLSKWSKKRLKCCIYGDEGCIEFE